VAQGGRLWVVFGCGGDRDKGKRPLMAQVAQTHADVLVVTDDNPRSEEAALIRQEILVGLTAEIAVSEIAERAQAIAYAISEAQPGDVVVIAGKGHEGYQEINGVRTHFSDLEQAQHALQAKEVTDV